MQAFLGNVQQALGFQVDLTARIGAGIIAIEAIDLAAGIDRNDVAGADLLLTAGDAVNDRVVHADARRGREAIQVQEVRSCTVAHDKVVDDFVDLCRGNTREVYKRQIGWIFLAITQILLSIKRGGVWAGGSHCAGWGSRHGS